jgi:UDP-N-acetylglucosamine 2-epimerase (non-hydrolysing)
MSDTTPTICTFVCGRVCALRLAGAASALAKSNNCQSQVYATYHPHENLQQILDCHGATVRHTIILSGHSEEEQVDIAKKQLWQSLQQQRPALLLVAGGSPLSLAAAQLARRLGIPVALVYPPLNEQLTRLPRQFQRCLWQTSAIAQLHLLADEPSREYLLAENPVAGCANTKDSLDEVNVNGGSGAVSVNTDLGQVTVVGGLVAENVNLARQRLKADPELRQEVERHLPFTLPGTRLLIVVAIHDSHHPQDLTQLCQTIAQVLEAGWSVVFPVELKPYLLETVYRALPWHPGLHLLEPLDYLPSVQLSERATAILSDSLAAAEIASSMRKPLFSVGCPVENILNAPAAEPADTPTTSANENLIRACSQYLAG